MRAERMSVASGIAILALLTACAGDNQTGQMESQRKGGDDRTGEYMPVEGFWKDHPEAADGYGYAQISGVAADTPDRIIVGIRGDLTPEREERPNSSNYLVVVNGSGDVIERWTQWDTLVGFPHHIFINPYDPERHIWVVDRGGTMRTVHEQILKFTNDGSELVMRLRDPSPTERQGGPVARDNPNPGPLDFGQQSSLTFFPNGDFLVSDGYQNGRVIRYDAQGEFISEFGSVGNGPGQFDLVHGVAVDRDRRIYVVDRRNSRVQIFTEDGEFIEEWPDIMYPSGIHIDEHEGVWLWSGALNRILKYDTNGILQHHFGTYGGVAGGGTQALPRSGFAGGVARPHQITVDPDGNVYVASYAGPWVNKFTPKPGADPSKLIGQPLTIEPAVEE